MLTKVFDSKENSLDSLTWKTLAITWLTEERFAGKITLYISLNIHKSIFAQLRVETNDET